MNRLELYYTGKDKYKPESKSGVYSTDWYIIMYPKIISKKKMLKAVSKFLSDEEDWVDSVYHVKKGEEHIEPTEPIYKVLYTSDKPPITNKKRVHNWYKQRYLEAKKAVSETRPHGSSFQALMWDANLIAVKNYEEVNHDD